MFGVPDEITDMTRSLEMVETKRFIYWKVTFGQHNGSGCFRVPGVIGTPPPPGKFMGLHGL